MKLIIGCVLLSFVTILKAEQVIEPAPLSIEDDGTRKIKIKSAQTSEAPSLPATHSIDGQLKLNEGSAPSDLKDKNETKEADLRSKEKSQVEKVELVRVFLERKRFIQFSIALLNSHYDKVDASLDNGSTISSLRFVGDYNQHFQIGIGAEVVSDTSGQKIPDNIRALNYRLFVDRHLPVSFLSDQFEWLSSLSFSMGDYGIKKRYINGLGQEVSQKLKEGLLFGLIPGAGMRICLGETGSLDLMAEYHLYFGKPQTYIGGFAFSPRFNLEF